MSNAQNIGKHVRRDDLQRSGHIVEVGLLDGEAAYRIASDAYQTKLWYSQELIHSLNPGLFHE